MAFPGRVGLDGIVRLLPFEDVFFGVDDRGSGRSLTGFVDGRDGAGAVPGLCVLDGLLAVGFVGGGSAAFFPGVAVGDGFDFGGECAFGGGSGVAGGCISAPTSSLVWGPSSC